MSRQQPELSPADHEALAPLLTALTAPPSSSELDGIAPTLAALRTARVTTQPSPSPRRRPSMITTLAGAKLGATIAGIAVGLGGAATVVYVSSNVPLSSTHATASPTTVPVASPTTDATGTTDATETETETPDPTDSADPSKTPDSAKTPDATATAVGPDATGPAAHGLCTAWRAITSHGNGHGKALDSVAFTNLAKAAGGADKIAAYCATVAAPGASGTHATGKPSTAPGKPTTAPKGRRQGTPTGKPTTAPTGRPATTPPAHPSGRH